MSNNLLITCSCGHGHVIATENIKRQLEKTPGNKVVVFNIAPYIIGPKLSCIDTIWNFNMRHGTHAMEILPKLLVKLHFEAFYEKCLHFLLSKKLKALITAHDIDTIYDSQPLYTNLMLNLLSESQPNKKLNYHKVLTDLPTHRTQHFLPGIKRVQHANNVNFKLHAKQPLLEEDRSEAAFWQKECGLSLSDIDSQFALPVSPEYLNPPKLEAIEINIPNPLADYYQLDYKNKQLTLPKKVFVTTLMLGSQGLTVIPDYVEQYIAQAKERPTNTPHIFFVASSRNTKLYQKLEQRITQNNLKTELPQHIILPLPMQTPSSIAQLMWHSQQIIMRPSGLSCLEQLALAQTREHHGLRPQPKIWIHAPCQKPMPETSDASELNSFLLAQCFGYERGNAEYLLSHLDAQLSTPKTIDLFTYFT